MKSDNPNTKSEGAEWERDVDYILYNLRLAIRSKLESSNIGPYKNDVEKYKAELMALVAHQRQQAVAEFAREVLAKKYISDDLGGGYAVNEYDIENAAKQRGITL